VLCVGGLTGARNHYRAEIEIRAGRFLHHDGGREDNLHRLTPMLAAADIVICASGNISHNAYHLVKSTCKKLGKPCVLVKGTGIASFLDGLGHLAADDAPRTARRAATASCAASASGSRRAKMTAVWKNPKSPYNRLPACIAWPYRQHAKTAISGSPFEDRISPVTACAALARWR
jgi:hypothetical protein